MNDSLRPDAGVARVTVTAFGVGRLNAAGTATVTVRAAVVAAPEERRCP